MSYINYYINYANMCYINYKINNYYTNIYFINCYINYAMVIKHRQEVYHYRPTLRLVLTSSVCCSLISKSINYQPIVMKFGKNHILTDSQNP